MAQWVQALAAKSNNLSSVSEVHMGEKERELASASFALTSIHVSPEGRQSMLKSWLQTKNRIFAEVFIQLIMSPFGWALIHVSIILTKRDTGAQGQTHRGEVR